jgi:hypothetical protein
MKPSFDAVAMVLEMDSRMLFLQDARGHVPLYYVREEQWGRWINFLESRKDEFWPKRSSTLGEERDPLLTKSPPNSRPIRDPVNALPTRIAAMVAAGSMKPEEVEYLLSSETQHSTTIGTNGDDNSDYDSDDDSNSDNDSSFFGSDDDSECSLELLLSTLPIRPRVMAV